MHLQFFKGSIANNSRLFQMNTSVELKVLIDLFYNLAMESEIGAQIAFTFAFL